jgi:hypothetical protein
MVKLIRRNQKTFLTGLTIVSMITFLISYGTGGNRNGAADGVYGTLNGTKIYISEVQSAKAELSAVNRMSYEGRDYQPHSLVEAILNAPGLPEEAMARLGLPTELAEKPELLVMLRHEADAADIQANNDQVQTIMVNQGKEMDQDSDQYRAARAGVQDLLKIRARFEQIAGAVKVSKPQADTLLARYAEKLELNLVQLSASDFTAKVPPPTTQQVQDQFTKFADTPANHPNDTDPFGFGYRLPLRTRLQYVEVPIGVIKAAVIATKSPYEWKVAAEKYYLKHATDFTSPAPVQGPTTGPSALPPIQQTFDQAQDHVLDIIRQPLVDSMCLDVQSFINSTLNTDYAAYLDYCKSGSTAGEPDSSLGVAYSSFSYISKLIERVKSRFNLVIIGGQTPEYLSIKDVGLIPGVGSAKLADFAQRQANTYLDLLNKKDPAAPAVLTKPSPPPYNASDPKSNPNIIFARLIAALPEQAPPSVASVQSQVESDVKTAAAYQLAQDLAASISLSAKTGNLVVAAIASGHPIISLQGESALSYQAVDVNGLYPPLGDSVSSFTKQAFELLSDFNPTPNPHPVRTIDLKEQALLFVAQLTGVKARWSEDSYFDDQQEARLEAASKPEIALLAEWYNYDAVVKRTGFVPTKKN